MANMYLDPNGRQIDFKAWKDRTPDDYLIHVYEGKKIRATLTAANLIRDANLIPAHLHKRYQMDVVNILRTDAMGEPYPEPKYVEDRDGSKGFADRASAVEAYKHFIATWDYSAVDKDTFAALDSEATVTPPPVPKVTLKPKDMALKIKRTKPVEEEDWETKHQREQAEAEQAEEEKAQAEKAAQLEKERAAPGNDAPTVSGDSPINDAIGAW